MQKTEKFFIFSWRELTVIGMLILISLGFFFTLGLHYGKKLNPPQAAEVAAGKLEESPEAVPAKDALDQAAPHAAVAASEAIHEATESEIKKENVKAADPAPVDLPQEKVTQKVQAEASAAKYAIQLGSYPNQSEAQNRVKLLRKKGLHAEIKTALVNEQTRYRVILPGFKNRQAADQHGKELKKQHKFENYIVIKV